MPQKTVTTFAELKSAIQDTSSTEIILANNITFSAGGIQIPKNKGNIVLNGNGYTITDYNSGAYTDTIYFANTAGPDISFTLKNVIWNGRNYYGVICAYDSRNNSNVSIILNLVTYTGPQLIYNRYGLTRLQDCNISIEQNDSIAAPQELGEVNRIVIAGKVNVQSKTTGTSVLWFPYEGSAFTVEANASFILNAPSTYLFYTDTAAKPVLTFKENSITDITVRNGLFYAAGAGAHIASSFTLDNGASFKATSLASSGVPVFKCSGTFSASAGSSFQLISLSAGSSPLMYFANPATISFQNPKQVVLYSNGGQIFSFQSGSAASPNTLNITAEQINIWSTAKTPYSSAGDFSDLPTRAFYKSGYASDISSSTQTTSNTVLSVTNNVLSSDGGYPMDSSSFNIFNARVLSIGKLLLTPDSLTDLSDTLSGKTDAVANLRAEFIGNTLFGTAAMDGSFSLPLSAKLPVDTKVTFSSNKNFLFKQMTVIVAGSVSVTRLTELNFYTFAVPYRRTIVKRLEPNWFLEVTDTRKNGGDWYLYASLKEPLQTETEQLSGSLTFYQYGIGQPLSETPLLVKQGTWSSPPKVTHVSWSEMEGFLLTVFPDQIYPSGKYVGQIQWEVTTEKKQ